MFRTRLKALRKRSFLTGFLLSPLSSLLSLKTLLSLKGPSSLPSTTTGTKDCNSTHFLLVAICKFVWGKFRSLITSSREISISLSSRCTLEHVTIFSLMGSCEASQLFECLPIILNNIVGSQVERLSMQVHEYNNGA